MRTANKNARRQHILEKHISRLFEKLSLLKMTITQKTVAASIAIGALAFAPQTVNAQSFAPKQINPFSLSNVNYESAPTFADLDGDGDLDMLSGTDDYFYNSYTYSYEYRFQYFENTGTVLNPVFAAPVENPFGIIAPAEGRLTPSFVDLDNDGDMDVMFGDNNGDFYYLENTGTSTAPAFAPAQANPFGLVNIYYYTSRSTPTFADLDNDGDLDMLSGGSSGDFYYFENTGTVSAPAFAAVQQNPFGLGYITGRSAPSAIDLDGDGDLDLMSGDSNGDLYYFENTGSVSAPAFAAYQVNPFNLTQVGSYTYTGRSKPTFVDLDNDGDIDLMAGDEYGDFNYYKRCLPTTSTISATSVCSYIAPSGQFLTASGTYTDVIANATGCDSVITINLTINPVLNQSFVNAAPVICGTSGSASINMLSSQSGVSYYLRDNANDAVIDGPILGTGSGISFNTGVISTPTTYNVFGVKQTNSIGVMFNDPNVDTKSIDCTNNPSVQLSGTQITLEAWVYPTQWRNNVWEGNIINKEGSGDLGYMLRCGNNGEVNFNLGNGAWNELTSPASSLSLNAWQHVAGTYDGTTMSIYVNGNLVASQPMSITFTSPNSSLTVGNWSNGSGRAFIGNIDEVRVWSAAKTQGDIQASMNTCLAGTESGLAAYYQFENGAGSTIVSDITSNGNNGLLQNLDVNADWGMGAVVCATCEMEMTQLVTVTFGATVDNTVSTVSSPTLSANQSGATYQWVDCNNSNAPIAGETAQTFTATTSGSYAVEVTFNGCTATSACETITVTGIQEASSTAVSVYPNPTTGVVNINLGNNNSNVEYSITTIEGRVVESGRTTSNMIKVDLSKEGNGIYFLRINSDKTSTVQKLIKQ